MAIFSASSYMKTPERSQNRHAYQSDEEYTTSFDDDSFHGREEQNVVPSTQKVKCYSHYCKIG